MTVEVVVFNAAGLLPAALEAEIRAGIGDGIAALRRHLDVEGAGIVVLLAEGVDAETGMGGRAYGPDACEIRVDEASPALRVRTRVNAASVAVHELHHVLRMRHGMPRRFADLCAGDIIVLEGLATRCQSFLGYPDPSMVRGITAEQVAPCWTGSRPSSATPGRRGPGSTSRAASRPKPEGQSTPWAIMSSDATSRGEGSRRSKPSACRGARCGASATAMADSPAILQPPSRARRSSRVAA